MLVQPKHKTKTGYGEGIFKRFEKTKIPSWIQTQKEFFLRKNLVERDGKHPTEFSGNAKTGDTSGSTDTGGH
jgi:hypothetical protein